MFWTFFVCVLLWARCMRRVVRWGEGQARNTWVFRVIVSHTLSHTHHTHSSYTTRTGMFITHIERITHANTQKGPCEYCQIHSIHLPELSNHTYPQEASLENLSQREGSTSKTIFCVSSSRPDRLLLGCLCLSFPSCVFLLFFSVGSLGDLGDLFSPISRRPDQ